VSANKLILLLSLFAAAGCSDNQAAAANSASAESELPKSALPESVLYEGVAVDLKFRGAGPSRSDPIFAKLASFGFVPTDDYYGIASDSDEGDDVWVWLSPLVAGKEVHDHDGPFDGLRLRYCVLRHPEARAKRFVEVVGKLAAELTVDAHDCARGTMIPAAQLAARLQADVAAVVDHWQKKGIRCGSSAALEIDW
jgi:hypothetical protein